MKKFIFFPLWKIESLEQSLEDLEQKGYRLVNVKNSYWFTFKVATPKVMHYFLSYKSFRGASMGNCDYALESAHNASLIDSKMCYYTLYRTKESKDKLPLLYEVRLDYIRKVLLEKVLTTIFLTALFTLLLILEINSPTPHKATCILWILVAICACLTFYNLFGFIKQRTKCKKYEQKNRFNH